MELEITIYDGDGNIAEHHCGLAQMATDAEINDMVAMIEAGTPAYIAAMLAKQSNQLESGQLCGGWLTMAR
jgi:hypothetical protein